jgi:hypothetical protein
VCPWNRQGVRGCSLFSSEYGRQQFGQQNGQQHLEPNFADGNYCAKTALECKKLMPDQSQPNVWETTLWHPDTKPLNITSDEQLGEFNTIKRIADRYGRTVEGYRRKITGTQVIYEGLNQSGKRWSVAGAPPEVRIRMTQEQVERFFDQQFADI